METNNFEWNYKEPSNDSVNATEWLKSIPKNQRKNKNGTVGTKISSKSFLNSLCDLGYIDKVTNASGYIPKDIYYQEGIIEVAENYNTSRKHQKKSYNVLFTPKGQDVLMPIIEELIEIWDKNNKK